MLKVASVVLAVIASLVIVDSLSAQQSGQKQRHHRGSPSLVERLERNKDLNLTADQKAKLEALNKEYAPKRKELAGTMGKILTPEQKQARAEAVKAARQAGTRGPEVRKSIQAAMKLTDAQKTKLAESRKAMQTLNKQIRDEVGKILTPEQKEVLKKARAHRGNHRNRGSGGHNQQPSRVS